MNQASDDKDPAVIDVRARQGTFEERRLGTRTALLLI